MCSSDSKQEFVVLCHLKCGLKHVRLAYRKFGQHGLLLVVIGLVGVFIKHG